MLFSGEIDFVFQVNSMDGWGITNTIEGYVIEAGNTIAVKAKDDIDDPSKALYWVAPEDYLGNKVRGGRGLCGRGHTHTHTYTQR